MYCYLTPLSSPADLMIQTTENADILKLLRLAKVVNKYQFSSFEEWVKKVLLIQCVDHSYLAKCPFDHLAAFLYIASLYNDDSFRNVVEYKWIFRLAQRDIPLAQSLVLVEKHGSRKLQGMVYYYIVQDMETHPCGPVGDSTTVVYGNDLNQEQLHRAYVGYYSLSRYWAYCRKSPPALLPQKCNETQHVQCNIRWTNYWASSINSIRGSSGELDLISKFDQLAREPPTSIPHVSRNCASHAGEVVRAVRQKFMSTIPDHFFGPLPQEAPGPPQK